MSESQKEKSTQQFTTETGMKGDYCDVKSKDIAIIDEELPETMMKCIKIIERLLTQSKFHEAHVLYKDYPAADVSKVTQQDDENAEKKDKPKIGFGGGDDEKEDKADEEDEQSIYDEE